MIDIFHIILLAVIIIQPYIIVPLVRIKKPKPTTRYGVRLPPLEGVIDGNTFVDFTFDDMDMILTIYTDWEGKRLIASFDTKINEWRSHELIAQDSL